VEIQLAVPLNEAEAFVLQNSGAYAGGCRSASSQMAVAVAPPSVEQAQANQANGFMEAQGGGPVFTPPAVEAAAGRDVVIRAPSTGDAGLVGEERRGDVLMASIGGLVLLCCSLFWLIKTSAINQSGQV
jgi:hypothetical protein